MSRIKTLKTRANKIEPRVKVSAPDRIRGRQLQDIRLKAWLEHPYCAVCGKPVGYPEGFELDHIVPLYKGGSDDQSNRQILCVDVGDQEGCHAIKTREDMRV